MTQLIKGQLIHATLLKGRNTLFFLSPKNYEIIRLTCRGEFNERYVFY